MAFHHVVFAEVRIGNSSVATGAENPVACTIPPIPSQSRQRFGCHGVGQHVTLRVPSSTAMDLTLCEVQVRFCVCATRMLDMAVCMQDLLHA